MINAFHVQDIECFFNVLWWTLFPRMGDDVQSLTAGALKDLTKPRRWKAEFRRIESDAKKVAATQ